MQAKPSAEQVWRSILVDGFPMLRRNRRWMIYLPSEPRCKMCNQPFGGAGGFIMRTILHRTASNLNPNLCNMCEELVQNFPGGCELQLTLLFADIRGSTGLAERMSPSEFSQLMNRFYSVATESITQTDGLIEKFVGDEVVAMYTPGIAGENYTRQAIHSAQMILRSTGHGRAEGAWVPVGVGIHTGPAFVGSVGTAGVAQISVLGDTPNATARLASVAKAGEILVSEDSLKAAGLNLPDLECRELELKGRSEPLSVRVLHADTPLN